MFLSRNKRDQRDGIDEDKVTKLDVMLHAHNFEQCFAASSYLCSRFLLSPLLSEITYNICQRTDTADGAVTIVLQQSLGEMSSLLSIRSNLPNTFPLCSFFSFRFSFVASSLTFSPRA